MVATEKTAEDWDNEFYDIKANLELAKRNEDKAQAALTEAKVKVDRSEALQRRSTSMTSTAKGREAEAKRKVEEAGRRKEEARRKGLPHTRWESEAHRWRSEGARSAQDAQRWELEARRQERAARELGANVRAQMAVYQAAAGETHGWEQRYKALALVRPRTVTEKVEEPPTLEETPFTVTPTAAAALMDTLSQLDHQSNQILRLTLDPASKISIALDSEREGDQIVKAGDTPVLLIEPRIRDSMQGKTLDARASENGTQIVLTG